LSKIVEIIIMAKKKKKSDKFLYVPTTGRVKVRFVGEQVEMFQYFNRSYFNGNGGSPNISSAFAPALMSSQNTTPEERVFFREEDNGDEAYSRSKRVVSLVIDRMDEKVKAFATPISVWNMMTEHAKDNDFEIWREGHGLQTRYFVEPLGLSEVSDDQQISIDATLESYTFADIFVKKKWEVVKKAVERVRSRWYILDFS